MNHEKLILFQKTYDLILEIHPVITKFPKNQRFVLGQKIENTLITILEIVIVINLGKATASYFKKLDIEIQKLKIFIRLAKDFTFINLRKYASLEEKVIEIGRLLGGFQQVLI
ncbi:MAG TPA: diversity-generating retroelement protein Avd [Candidatus Pacearchaeota archaeon]|nr:diversity-generating retroelement protein Avd [Candidatus Pacearchaeota archaeon]HOI60418.1 diversity-generating retroelement protein Avd [Candidatus Pacearchaeota archaeon]